MNGYRPSTTRKLVDQAKATMAAAEAKAFVEGWIAETIAGDAALGRTGACFTQPPEQAVGQAARRALLERGVVCYAGSGNYFQADLKTMPVAIIQRRPLAQRYVRLFPGGTA